MLKKIHFFNIIGFFILIILLTFLYKNYQYKKNSSLFLSDPYHTIKKYLLSDMSDLESKQKNENKPILWIHVPYDYNARNWESWGSRSSYQLNQPYLYLTVESIIAKCDKSFTICMIDDNSFPKLLPHWKINMDTITSPISDNMRSLGLTKLIHTYGGMICPISFLCMKDLIGLYQQGTNGDHMFVCENVSRNINSTHKEFCPDITFFGAPRENRQIKNLCDYISRISGQDFTAQSVFLGNFARWCKLKSEKGEINLISAEEIGRKTHKEGAPILVEDLLGRNYLDLDIKRVYGIYIPAQEILSRKTFEWFARCSPEQILSSDTIIGNYFLLNQVPMGRKEEPMFLEPFKEKPKKWVGYWRTPLVAGLWGAKPNYLGNNMMTVPFPGDQ